MGGESLGLCIGAEAVVSAEADGKFYTFCTQHAFAPFKRNGTKLEKASLSTDVFKGHA